MTWRGAQVDLRTVRVDSESSVLSDVDVIVAGGGPDSEQVAVARGLERLGDELNAAIARGASLLAVCGAFQNLGHSYEMADGSRVNGPGLLNVHTVAPKVGKRMVGGVVVRLDSDSPILAAGCASAKRAGFAGHERTVVGFENHAGRTVLGAGVRPLGRVSQGQGNNGDDSFEGMIALPFEGGQRGLRIATYLHGPLLPANPHVADLLLLAALERHGVHALGDLDDTAEWAAHAAAERRWSR